MVAKSLSPQKGDNRMEWLTASSGRSGNNRIPVGRKNKANLLLTRRPGVPVVSADRLPQPLQNLSYLELSGVHRAVRLWSKSSGFLYLHTLWPKYLALGHRESKSTSTESKSTLTVQVPTETNRCCVSLFLRICNHSVTFLVSCSTTAPASGNIDLAEVSRLWLLTDVTPIPWEQSENWHNHKPEMPVNTCAWLGSQSGGSLTLPCEPAGQPTVPPSTQTQSDSPTHWRAYRITTSLWLNSPTGTALFLAKPYHTTTSQTPTGLTTDNQVHYQ